MGNYSEAETHLLARTRVKLEVGVDFQSNAIPTRSCQETCTSFNDASFKQSSSHSVDVLGAASTRIRALRKRTYNTQGVVADVQLLQEVHAWAHALATGFE
eukprot:3707545-Amphidinium_carterae.1